MIHLRIQRLPEFQGHKNTGQLFIIFTKSERYTAPGEIMFRACYTCGYEVKSFIPPFMVRGQQN